MDQHVSSNVLECETIFHNTDTCILVFHERNFCVYVSNFGLQTLFHKNTQNFLFQYDILRVYEVMILCQMSGHTKGTENLLFFHEQFCKYKYVNNLFKKSYHGKKMSFVTYLIWFFKAVPLGLMTPQTGHGSFLKNKNN